MNIKTISPTRQTPYTIGELLKKFLIRSHVTGSVSFQERHTCFYGSEDKECTISALCPPPDLGEGPKIEIFGTVRMHRVGDYTSPSDMMGRITIGFECGADWSHGGQFPQDAEPDNPNWDYYQDYNNNEQDLTLLVTLGEETEEMSFFEKDLEQEDQKTLLYIIQRLALQQVWGSMENLK